MRKRKLKLWRIDPHCHWCGILTVIREYEPHQSQLPNDATVDHLRSRWSKERGKDKTESTVLACYKCNQERNEKEQSSVPKVKAWERSGRYPKTFKELSPIFDASVAQLAEAGGLNPSRVGSNPT